MKEFIEMIKALLRLILLGIGAVLMFIFFNTKDLFTGVSICIVFLLILVNKE
jgi:hypothetical protein